MSQKEKPKMYVVRKYVMAISVEEALKKEKRVPVHDVSTEDRWFEKNMASAIGFSVSDEE